MASYEDIELAQQRTRGALERCDLEEAKAGLDELEELSRVFTEILKKSLNEAQRATAESWLEECRSQHAELRERYDQLELEMLDPKFEERRARRESEKQAREEAEHAKAMQMLQGLGGFGQALAGLASLGRPSSAPAAAESEQVCGACSTSNPQRAKFCMECGQALRRVCAGCGAELGKAKFCPECGTKA